MHPRIAWMLQSGTRYTGRGRIIFRREHHDRLWGYHYGDEHERRLERLGWRNEHER